MRLSSCSETILYSAVESDYKEPANYNQMLKRPESEKILWMEGMDKELSDFKKRVVYRIIKILEVPEGRKLIGSK